MRRLLAIGAATVLLLTAGVSAPPMSDPAGGVSTNVLGGQSFLEVGHDGDLRSWTGEAASTYVPQRVGPGWGSARLVTGLDGDRFLEVRDGGGLYDWALAGTGWQATYQGSGWGATKMITGQNDSNFLEINGNDELYQWTFDYGAATWNRSFVGGGWGDTRLLAGLDTNFFLQVKHNGQLWEWGRSDGTFTGRLVGSGWTGVRLLAGVSATRFVAVRDDGVLVEWNWNATTRTYEPSPVAGGGWGNARLLG